MEPIISRAAGRIKRSRNLVALTGAGISVESGIPDFRSRGGLWEKYDPAIYATIDSFQERPEQVWEMFFEMAGIISGAEPNPGHYALVLLEKMGYLKSVITQNIDNLHQAAGSKNVVEYHGNASRLICTECGEEYGIDEFRLSEKNIPRCSECGIILKPGVVFYGEMIPPRALHESRFFAESADTVMVIGTSAEVFPAAALPAIAKSSGATIIEFNIENSELTENITDIFIEGPSEITLPEIVSAIKQIKEMTLE